MELSHGGTPKSSAFIGFSINHPAIGVSNPWGYPHFRYTRNTVGIQNKDFEHLQSMPPTGPYNPICSWKIFWNTRARCWWRIRTDAFPERSSSYHPNGEVLPFSTSSIFVFCEELLKWYPTWLWLTVRHGKLDSMALIEMDGLPSWNFHYKSSGLGSYIKYFFQWLLQSP